MLPMTPYEFNTSLRVCLHPTVSVSHHLSTNKDQSLPDHIPPVSTLRALLTRHLDINAVPKRSFFRVFKHFAIDEREREKLEEFSSPGGAVK
jgi:sulfite reductase alpha subunit-like flavoprotein